MAPALVFMAIGDCLSLDVKLLGVQRGIALDENVFADEFLEFVEPGCVVLLEDLYGFRIDAHQDIVPSKCFFILRSSM